MDVIYLRIQENEDSKEEREILRGYLPTLTPSTQVIVEKASSFNKQVRLHEILKDPKVKAIHCYSLHRLLACPPSKVWGFLVNIYSSGKLLYLTKGLPSGTIKSLLDAIAQYQKEHRAELDSLGHKLGRSSVSPDIGRIKALRETPDKKGRPTSWREIERLTGVKKSTAQRKLKEHLELQDG